LDTGKGSILGTEIHSPIAKAKGAQNLSSLPAPPATILVVDDDVEILRMVAGFLKDFGYAVQEAQSAIEAALVLSQLRGRIDMLITDLDLGTDLGTELAAQLVIAKPSLKVLVISGRVGPGETLTFEDHRFPCLRKPFTRTDLQKRIQDVLGTP
jgi:CheY-like chemotaxis protein